MEDEPKGENGWELLNMEEAKTLFGFAVLDYDGALKCANMATLPFWLSVLKSVQSVSHPLWKIP